MQGLGSSTSSMVIMSLAYVIGKLTVRPHESEKSFVIITYWVTDDYMGNRIFLKDFDLDRVLLSDFGNCTWISLLDVLGWEGVVGGGGTCEMGNGGWKAGSCRNGACDTSGSGGGGGIEKKTSLPCIGGGMNGGGGAFNGCKTSSFECRLSFSRFRYFIIQQQARQDRKATITRPTQVTLNIRIRSFLWSFSTHTWYSKPPLPHRIHPLLQQ